MAMTIDDANVVFEGVIYEDEVVALRDHLQSKAPDAMSFSFEQCQDVHTAVVQQILAYKMIYTAQFSFSDENSMYKKLLLGFETDTDRCYQ